jgi:hypothetical protein
MKNLPKLTLAIALTSLTVAPAFATPRQDGSMPAKGSMMMTMTSMFKGAEVNGGTASIVTEKGKHILRLSDDFKIPNAPAPHFQVVDKAGNTYLLSRLTVIGGKTHREVVLPSYVKSVSKVQIYCAFAEVVLGEAKFDQPVMVH